MRGKSSFTHFDGFAERYCDSYFESVHGRFSRDFCVRFIFIPVTRHQSNWREPVRLGIERLRMPSMRAERLRGPRSARTVIFLSRDYKTPTILSRGILFVV